MKIGGKLVLAFVSVALLGAAVGVVGVVNIQAISAADTLMYRKMTVPITDLLTITESFQRVRVNIREMLYVEDAGEIARYEDTIDGLSGLIDEASASYESRLITADGRKLYETFIAARDEYRSQLEKFIDLKKRGEAEAAQTFLHDVLTKTATKEQEAINVMVSDKLRQAKETEMANTRLGNTSTLVMLIGVVLAAAISIALGVLLSRSITRPLGRAVALLGEFAKGDLRSEVPAVYLKRSDEIGEVAAALKALSEDLRRIVAEILAAAAQLAAGSEEISSTAQQLSQGATEQASSAEEVSASVEEMAATVKQNSDNSLATEGIATRSATDADGGGKAVMAAVEAIKQIASKISIIDEIARQTNLLALNAAIEAARAGEAGKGFAVVASEVRKLAERSQNASGEIGDLSAATVESATKAGEVIQNIVPDIRKTSELVQEISSASSEQSAGVEQIAKAMTQLDTIIQQNASASEEMASMAEELSGQAEQLSQTMSFFKLGDAETARGTTQGAPRRAGVARLPRKTASLPPAVKQGIPPKAPTAITVARDVSEANDDEFEAF